MQVHELLYLTEFLRDFFTDKQLATAYQQLIEALNQAASGNNPGQVAPKIDRVREIHRAAQEVVLSPAQEKLLRDFGTFSVLGESALADFERILRKNQAHLQGLAKALQPLKDKADAFQARAAALVDPLREMVDSAEDAQLGPDEGRLWLYFAEATSVQTVEDLEAAAKTWKEVLHHFSRLPGADAGAGRILHVAKHSPLELELAAQLVLLAPLGFGIKFVLDRIEQVIRIRKGAEEFRQLRVKGELLDMIKADAEEKRSEIASDGADAVIERFGGDNETRTAVQRGLRQVIDFVEGGGELDIDVPAVDQSAEDEEGGEAGGDDDPTRFELRGLIRSIRRDMKLLGSGGEADDGKGSHEPE